MQYGNSKSDMLPNAIIQEHFIVWTALHNAAAAGDDKKLLSLLDGNVDRTAKESKRGNTPLHEAAWRGYSRCVNILCSYPKKGKSRKLGDPEGGLVMQSSILHIQNNNGFSPLHLAAQNGHNQSCRELLLSGADPHIQNIYGDTPLHTSCRYGHAGAARILLSAYCDPNKTNSNRDTPLHITCAMGRRKLTRILIEANCELKLKNTQEETPREIAIRKNFKEIVEILDNPQRMRNKQEKRIRSSGCASTKNNPKPKNCTKEISWSPYGCHYFPDPRSFPSPKLDTLPKEPLKKGEQYYLDLAGHIRKGPIGCGNICYCGPFFRHIEDKINYNRKSLQKCVQKVQQSLGNKVQALALRTNDQIEQLTRTMMEDRIRCENRRIHIDNWLRRGEPLRSTTNDHLISKKFNKTIETVKRCRSLELLENMIESKSRLANSKSCGLLERELLPMSEKIERSDNENNNPQKSTSSAIISIDNLELALYETSAQKSKEVIINSNDKIAYKDGANGNITDKSKEPYKMFQNENHKIYSVLNTENFSQSICNNYLTMDHIGQSKQNSSDEDTLLESQQHSKCTSNAMDICKRSTDKGLHDKRHDLSGLNQNITANICDSRNVCLNRHQICDKIGDNEVATNKFLNDIVPERTLCEVHSSLLEAHKVAITPIRIISEFFGSPTKQSVESSNNYQNNTTIVPENSSKHLLDCSVNGMIEKLEIKSSEIKSLKKKANESERLKKNKVQELVARLQGKFNSSQKMTQAKTENVDLSNVRLKTVKSKDIPNNNNENKSTHDGSDNRIKLAPNISMCLTSPIEINHMNTSTMLYDNQWHQNALVNRIIPKDAYFHKLPQRSKRPEILHESAQTTATQAVDYCDTQYLSNQQQGLCSQLMTSSNSQTHVSQLKTSNLQHSFVNSNILTKAAVAWCNTDLSQISPSCELEPVQIEEHTQHFVERDASNDSGFSNRTYGNELNKWIQESFVTDNRASINNLYSANNVAICVDTSNENDDSFAFKNNMENVSSLV